MVVSINSYNLMVCSRGVSRIQRKGGLSPKGSGMFKAHLGPWISIVSDSSIDWFNQKECDFYGVSLVPKLTHARKRLFE